MDPLGLTLLWITAIVLVIIWAWASAGRQNRKQFEEAFGFKPARGSSRSAAYREEWLSCQKEVDGFFVELAESFTDVVEREKKLLRLPGVNQDSFNARQIREEMLNLREKFRTAVKLGRKFKFNVAGNLQYYKEEVNPAKIDAAGN